MTFFFARGGSTVGEDIVFRKLLVKVFVFVKQLVSGELEAGHCFFPGVIIGFRLDTKLRNAQTGNLARLGTRQTPPKNTSV